MENYEINVENKSKQCVRSFPLPEFVSSFSIEKDPAFLDIPERKAWEKWIRETSFMTPDQFEKIQAMWSRGDVSVYFYPFSDISRYEVLHKYFNVLFVCDDMGEIEFETKDSDCTDPNLMTVPQQYQQILDKLQDNRVPMYRWKPYIMAQFATLEPIYQSYNEIQKRRFIKLWGLYIQGLNDESKRYGDKGNNHSLKELIEIREKCGATKAALQKIEYKDNIFISEELWESPDWQLLLDLASKNACFVNDLYSFEKEYKQNSEDLTKMSNLVAYIVIVDNCAIKEAMDKSVEIIRDNERQIHDIEDKILRENKEDSAVKQFIISLNYTIGGTYFSVSILDRYNKI